MEREEMEREGGREGRGVRGRGRRGIIVGGMVLGLLMGCNNGAIEELEKRNQNILSISNLRQGFLDVFATFGDLLKGTFGITATTTKKQVGEELGKVGEAVKTVKGRLESIKTDSNYELIKNKIESVIIKASDTLEKIVEGTNKIKEATASASGPIGGNDSDDQPANQANDKSVQGIVEGISKICEAAKDVNIELKGDDKKAIKDSKEVAKLFNTNVQANNSKAIDGAGRAVSAASGADILAAIVAVKEQKGVAGNISAATNAYDIAIAQKNDTDIAGNVKTNASAISAGLALRAMAQDGKLATHATNAPAQAVNAVLIGAVGKTVNEIVSTIRKTVDKCLKDVSDCVKENSSSEVKSK